MKKLNLSIGLFCAAAFLSLWCSPADAGVCFIVGGNCGQTVEAKDCTKLGYKSCNAATKEGAGKSCTSAGKNYYEKCQCKKSVFPVKASEVGEKYDGVSPQCSDDEGIHYTYKKCKDTYKYYEGKNSSGSVRTVYREDKITKAISCLEGAKADGDSCKMLYNATETLYEKCSCDRNTYKLNNKTESWYTLGGKCEDSSGNIYYSTATCASSYTQVSCSGNNVSEDTKTLYDYTGSTFKICYKCREKTCGEYGSYYSDEPSCKSVASATQTCAKVDKSLTGTRKCFKKIDITCPTGYYTTCPRGKECDTIAASNDTAKTCYKEKKKCSDYNSEYMESCSATTGKKCETVDSSTVGGLTCYKLVSTSTGDETETPKSCPAADSSKFPSGKTCFYHTSPTYSKGDCAAYAAPGSGTNNAGNGCYYICCSEGSSGSTGGLVVGPGGTGGGGNTEVPEYQGGMIHM